jgi:hypothetical protein
MATALAASTPVKFLEAVSALLSVTAMGFTLYFATAEASSTAALNWQSERSPDFMPLGSGLFFLFPFFHFGRIFDLILQTTRTAGDDGASHFYFNGMSRRGETEYSGSIDSPEGIITYRPEGVTFSLWMLSLLSLWYLVAAWYFGHLFSGYEGQSMHFYFPFQPTFWGFRRARQVGTDGLRQVEGRA